MLFVRTPPCRNEWVTYAAGKVMGKYGRAYLNVLSIPFLFLICYFIHSLLQPLYKTSGKIVNNLRTESLETSAVEFLCTRNLVPYMGRWSIPEHGDLTPVVEFLSTRRARHLVPNKGLLTIAAHGDSQKLNNWSY